MSASGIPESCGSDHCVTCADEGVPMRVLAGDAAELALCAAPDGARTLVETLLVGPVEPGDVVLVHAGAALARLAEGAPP